MWLLSLSGLLLSQSSPPIDPVEAAKVFGVAFPMIATLGAWLRTALKERDAALAQAALYQEQRLQELRDVLPLAQTMVAVAERLERRLD